MYCVYLLQTHTIIYFENIYVFAYSLYIYIHVIYIIYNYI